MTISFNQFLHMHRHGKLETMVSWRAYDIVAGIKNIHVKRALKALGLHYAGELALTHFMALYEVPTRDEARALLGGWWLLSQIEAGRHPKVRLRGLRGGYPTGSAAPQA